MSLCIDSAEVDEIGAMSDQRHRVFPMSFLEKRDSIIRKRLGVPSTSVLYEDLECFATNLDAAIKRLV